MGAKNSALKLMAVALLAVGRTTLTNVPAIADVTIMAELLRRLGVDVDYDPAPASSCSTCPSARSPRRLRARPCPARLHLGARPARGPGRRGRRRRPRGRRHRLARARPARGRSRGPRRRGARDAWLPRRHGAPRTARRRHPARLPERRGDREHPHGGRARARHDERSTTSPRSPRSSTSPRCSSRWARGIEGAGTSRIAVHGVEALAPTEHAVVPDRIAAGTWAFAAATTRGDIEVVGGVADHLRAPLGGARGGRLPRRGHRRAGSGSRRRRPAPGLRRRDAALPGLPDRPAALRPVLQRRGRRLGHGHGEPLRGALPHGPGAGPSRAPTPRSTATTS